MAKNVMGVTSFLQACAVSPKQQIKGEREYMKRRLFKSATAVALALTMVLSNISPAYAAEVGAGNTEEITLTEPASEEPAEKIVDEVNEDDKAGEVDEKGDEDVKGEEGGDTAEAPAAGEAGEAPADETPAEEKAGEETPAAETPAADITYIHLKGDSIAVDGANITVT